MILLIVYVGAVAVLFLFVVMMLNINLDDIKQQAKKYFLSSSLVVGVLLLELVFSFANYEILSKNSYNIINTSKLTNTHEIGKVMYTDYFFIFQLSGCILLVAMIGAIVLTLRRREGVLRQSIPKQLDRKRSDSIEIIKIKKS